MLFECKKKTISIHTHQPNRTETKRKKSLITKVQRNPINESRLKIEIRYIKQLTETKEAKTIQKERKSQFKIMAEANYQDEEQKSVCQHR